MQIPSISPTFKTNLPRKEGTIRLVSTYNPDAISTLHRYFNSFAEAGKKDMDYREIELFEGKKEDGSTLFGMKIPEKLYDIKASAEEWFAGLKEMFIRKIEYDLIENSTDELQNVARAYKRPDLRKK
jgi:hypothetical protein